MDEHKEKRKYQRLVSDSPMGMYRMDEQDLRYYARMNDYSPGGLSMTTSEKLVIGQLVYLEMTHHDPVADGPEKFKGFSGCIKWTAPYKEYDHESMELYKYGLEYLNPRKGH